jgi:serine phosphatase RsbU (regulator of sigma subunit)
LKKNYLLQVLLLLVLATALDRATGPDIGAAAFYIFPIALASWRFGKDLGYATALAAIALDLIMEWSWATHSSVFVVASNTLLLLIVFLTVCWLNDRISQQQHSIFQQRDELGRLNRRMEVEMRNARVLQKVLVGPLPQHPALELGQYQRTARILGGDLIYLSLRSDHRLSLVIGDVSGKGSPAALAVAVLIGLFEEVASRSDSPRQTLETLNQKLWGYLPDDMFITLFHATLDLETGEMKYVNAGHEWPVILFASGGKETLPSSGLPLGMYETIEYDEESIRLSRGDLLFCYTDGATDQRQPDGKRLGEERLIEIVEGNAQLPCEKLAATVGSFVGGKVTDLDDDMTLLALRFKSFQ